MFALALIAVLAAVLVGGCTDTPEESIEYFMKDFYAAYNAEDWEECLAHIDDTNNVGESMIESMLTMARAATGEVTVKSVTNISVTGSTATADVSITHAGGSETKEYPLVEKDGAYSLVFNDGRWKISWPYV